MIFAAGFGTRMGALTRDRPKPLVEVSGRPLIDHALDIAEAAKVGTVVANLHYLPEMLAAHLAPKGVKLSLETEAILETGGGLRQALPLLGPDPVFTLNSDAVWTGANPLDELRAAWAPEKMGALLLLLDKDQARGHRGTGDFDLDAEGRIVRGSTYVYSGAQIIATGALADVPEPAFSLNVVWNRLIAEGRLYGTTHRGGWCDVGSPDGIAEAEALLRTASDV